MLEQGKGNASICKKEPKNGPFQRSSNFRNMLERWNVWNAPFTS